MLATVVATTATLSSNSFKNAFLTHFTSVLQKQFAANDAFLREANVYKRALALRNAWPMYLFYYFSVISVLDIVKGNHPVKNFSVGCTVTRGHNGK